MSTPMSIGIAATNLSVRLGNGFRLRVTSFDCEPGATVCLIGANGSGKSLLLETLCGLNPHDGELTCYRVEQGQRCSVERASVRIGAVIQRFGLWSKAKVHDIMRLIQACGNAPDPLDEQLVRIRNRYLSELSTGEKQYLMFCVAFYSRSSLLCLDEPTLGLDGRMQERVLTLLRKDPRTKIMSLHSFTEMMACGSRCYFLCEGRAIPTAITPTGTLHRTATIQLGCSNHGRPGQILKEMTVDVDSHRAIELLNREIIPVVQEVAPKGEAELTLQVLLSRAVYDECSTSA